MKYGFAYIPTVGRLNTFKQAFHRAFRKAQLNQISRLEISFDPFTGKQAESLRLYILTDHHCLAMRIILNDLLYAYRLLFINVSFAYRLFAFHIDTPKIRQTNFKCMMKLNVLCDRTEPKMEVTFSK